MKVVYIGGYMRSGTTLLCQLLGQATDALDAGEVFGIWSHAAGGARCSCGASLAECELWGVALQSTGVPREQYRSTGAILEGYFRTRRFFGVRKDILHGVVPAEVQVAVRETQTLMTSALVASGRSVLIDSSKELPGILLHLAAGNDLAGVAHIVRDARAVAASEVRSLRMPSPPDEFAPPGRGTVRSLAGWHGTNWALVGGLRSLGLPRVRLRYEDLGTAPEAVVDAIVSSFAMPTLDGPHRTHTSHLAVGNPARMTFTGDVRLDERWRSELTRRQAATIGWVSAPATRLLSPTLPAAEELLDSSTTRFMRRGIQGPRSEGGAAAGAARKVERLVFWQDAPSIHFAPLIRAVADLGIETHVITERQTSPDRIALGWPAPDYGDAHLHLTPDVDQRRNFERELGPDSHHMFHGVGSYPVTTASLNRVAAGAQPPARISIFSEAWNPTGLKGKARPFRYRNWVRRVPDDVELYFLAGQLARTQFASAGVDPAKIRPIIYTVAAEPAAANIEAHAPVVFVGKLEPRKRVDLLIAAYASVQSDLDRPLRIVGDGPEFGALRRLVEELGIRQKVVFTGAADNDEVVAQLKEARALVLPSAFDGWGAVVNEAIHAGCMVIASSNCGATELLDDGRGSTFATRAELETELRRLRQGELLSVRAERAAWTSSATSPRAVARYLVEALGAPTSEPVQPPWL